MKSGIVWLCFVLIAFSPAYAQKASLHVRLLDSSFTSWSDYIFQVEIKNDSFPTYLIQDTARLRAQANYTGTGLMYVILEKKAEGGEYKSYKKVKRHVGDFNFDTCMYHCCNCLPLTKGQSIKLNLQLLQNFILEPGEYMIETILGPPLELCDDCEEQHLGEIYTDYYFKVP
jgi:hypothetical protein